VKEYANVAIIARTSAVEIAQKSIAKFKSKRKGVAVMNLKLIVEKILKRNFVINNVKKFFHVEINVRRNAVNVSKKVIMVNVKKNALEYYYVATNANSLVVRIALPVIKLAKPNALILSVKRNVEKFAYSVKSLA
jgi:hypothetical protein